MLEDIIDSQLDNFNNAPFTAYKNYINTKEAWFQDSLENGFINKIYHNNPNYYFVDVPNPLYTTKKERTTYGIIWIVENDKKDILITTVHNKIYMYSSCSPTTFEVGDIVTIVR